jgi:FeS assembly SUF system protein
MKPLPLTPDAPHVGAPAEPMAGETAGMTNDPATAAVLRPPIIEALSKVFDPEIPVNVYELGLIYDIMIAEGGVVGIRMTLTAPGCPAAQSLPAEVKRRISEIHGVTDVKVDIVWDPPWDRDRMSDAAKLQLGMF